MNWFEMVQCWWLNRQQRRQLTLEEQYQIDRIIDNFDFETVISMKRIIGLANPIDQEMSTARRLLESACKSRGFIESGCYRAQRVNGKLLLIFAPVTNQVQWMVESWGEKYCPEFS